MFKKEINRTCRNTLFPVISASPLLRFVLLNRVQIKILEYFIIA